jgi:hypothetical protein
MRARSETPRAARFIAIVVPGSTGIRTDVTDAVVAPEMPSSPGEPAAIGTPGAKAELGIRQAARIADLTVAPCR